MMKIKLIMSLLWAYSGVLSAKEIIRINHGFTGVIEHNFEILLSEFNASFPEYEAVSSSSGDYIKAFEQANSCEKGELLDVYHVSEFGSPTLIQKFAQSTSYTPVSRLLPDFLKIKFLGSLDIHYGQRHPALLYALPFNPSMGIAYYNEDLFKKAGLDPKKQLKTWQELIAAARSLKKAGYSGFTFPWLASYTYEYFTSIHGIYLTSGQNGFEEKHPSFTFQNDPRVIQFFNDFHGWYKEGLFVLISSISGEVEDFFAKGQCGILLQGSGRLENIKLALKKANHDFAMSFGPIPYDSRVEAEALTPKIGGGAFWVTKNSDGIKTFLKYLSSTPVQKRWSKLTGYIPATYEAYSELEKEHYFDAAPHVKAAINQVIGRKSGSFTHMRIGNYGAVREKLYNEHFKKFLEHETPDAQKFLNEFVQEAHKLINL